MKDKSQEFADRMVKALKDVDKHPDKYSSMEFDKDFAYGLDNEIEMTHLEKLKQDFIKKTATAIFDIFTDRNKKDTVVEVLEKNLNELIKDAQILSCAEILYCGYCGRKLEHEVCTDQSTNKVCRYQLCKNYKKQKK